MVQSNYDTEPIYLLSYNFLKCAKVAVVNFANLTIYYELFESLTLVLLFVPEGIMPIA